MFYELVPLSSKIVLQCCTRSQEIILLVFWQGGKAPGCPVVVLVLFVRLVGAGLGFAGFVSPRVVGGPAARPRRSLPAIRFIKFSCLGSLAVVSCSSTVSGITCNALTVWSVCPSLRDLVWFPCGGGVGLDGAGAEGSAPSMSCLLSTGVPDTWSGPCGRICFRGWPRKSIF